MIKTSKLVAAIVGLTMVLSLVGAVSASAITAQEMLQLLIAAGVIAPDKAAAATAALNAVSATPAVSGYTFTKDLTVGSRNADVTALQNKLGISPATGYFGALTKAAVIKFQLDNAISPAAGYVGAKTRAKLNASVVSVPTNPSGPVVVVPVAGSASVTLASSAVSASIPAGANQVPVLSLNFTAGNTDLVVTALNVYRGGISSDNDLQNVYLKDGSTVVATNLGINNGKVFFNQSNGLFTVRAGTTKTITVAVDLVAGASTQSHTYTFAVNSASDVAANAVVAGAFPIMSGQLQAVSVSNPALASLTVNSVGVGTSVNAGTTNFLAGEFTIQAQNSPVSVRSIKLTEVGSLNSAADLANIRLMNGSQQVGNVIPQLNADGTVVFDLTTNPMVIPSGQTVNLMLYVDVVGGVNRSFQFTLQRTYDLVGVDQTYNVGAAVTAVDPNTNPFPINNQTANKINVQQGTLTVNKDVASPSGYVVPGATNQVIAAFDVQANGEAVRITALNFGMTWGSAAVENTVFNNLKLVDDQGVQLGTTYTSGSASTTFSQNAALSNLNYIVPANTKRIVYVKADILSSATAVGSIYGTLSGIVGQGYTSLAAANAGSTYQGSTLSLSSVPFGATLNNSIGIVTTVAGSANVKVASFSLTAGPAEGVNVTSVTLSTASGVAGSVFQNLMVKVGSTQIGQTFGTIAAATGTLYTFSASSPIAIPVGGSVVVDVYANTVVGNTYSGSVVSLDSVSATGASTNNVEAAISPKPAGQTVNVTAGGTLTDSAASTPVPSQFVSMGVNNVKFASFKLMSDNNENLNVTQLVLTDAISQASAGIGNIRVMVGSTQVASQPSLGSIVGGISTTSINIPVGALVVPQNGNVQVDVIADVNGLSQGAVSSTTHSFSLASLNYQGASGQLKSIATSTASGTTLSVFRTNLNIAQGSSFSEPAGLSDGSLVAQIAYSAAVGNDVLVKSISLKNVGSLIKAGSSVPVKLYASNNPSILLASTTLGTTTDSTITLLNGGWTVPAGSTLTLQVKADLASATGLNVVANSTASYQVGIDGSAWNDGTTDVTSLDPSIQLPVLGQVINFQL
jgi:hypothetical protein